LLQERGVVGKNDYLKTPVRDLYDFMDGLPAAERILTVEGVVEHHNGILCSRIAFKMGKKKSESERRSVARAERVLEAGLVKGVLPSPTSTAVSLISS
jgi:hypothetical protein